MNKKNIYILQAAVLKEGTFLVSLRSVFDELQTKNIWRRQHCLVAKLWLKPGAVCAVLLMSS